MKKLLAVLAASAVAVSMFAFTGCGEAKKDPEGAIPGNYEEKTPEEIGGILDNFFGDDNTDTKPGEGNGDDTTETTSMNAGLKINLSGSVYAENMIDVSGSVKADLKMNSDDENVSGAGTATVKASAKMLSVENNAPVMKEMFSIDASGTAYADETYLYAGATGSFGSVDENGTFNSTTIPSQKVKVNMVTLTEILAGLVGGDIGSGDNVQTSPLAGEITGVEDGFSLATLLAMADEYGVKISADVSEGMKLKISATADTVWTVVTKVLIEEGATETEAAETVTTVKGFVTMNKFAVDIYVAFDNNKELTGASVVTDIDISVNMGILSLLPGAGSPNPMANEEIEMPDIAVKLTGSVEIYTHNETVTLPAGIANDTAYVDMTDTIIGMIEGMM